MGCQPNANRRCFCRFSGIAIKHFFLIYTKNKAIMYRLNLYIIAFIVLGTIIFFLCQLSEILSVAAVVKSCQHYQKPMSCQFL